MKRENYHKKVLIIQTASLGDVVLATSVAEKLHDTFPDSDIDILVKKGSESLFGGHPFIHRVNVWDKRTRKYRNLFRLLKEIRKERYDLIVNLHRFASSGLLTAFGRAKSTYGFRQNPFSVLFTRRVPHIIGGPHGLHEIVRNQQLLETFCPGPAAMPRLYPTREDFEAIQQHTTSPYITIAPMSLWFTKQFPAEQWIRLIQDLPEDLRVYLTGSASDRSSIEALVSACKRKNVISLASSLTLLQTAALMKGAVMNYTNDSAPLHLASAVNAPLTAVFCSTVPAFGFGPLSDDALVVETEKELNCRPCGLHGYRACPEKHFECAYSISIKKLTGRIQYERFKRP